MELTIRGGAEVCSMGIEDVVPRYHQAADELAMYATTDLVTILEIEHWTAKVGEREEATSFALRVTSTFRREADDWKLVHRHADPIATPDAEGPLRRR